MEATLTRGRGGGRGGWGLHRFAVEASEMRSGQRPLRAQRLLFCPVEPVDAIWIIAMWNLGLCILPSAGAISPLTFEVAPLTSLRNRRCLSYRQRRECLQAGGPDQTSSDQFREDHARTETRSDQTRYQGPTRFQIRSDQIRPDTRYQIRPDQIRY